MNEDQARQLVRDTFTHRFQKDQFRRFMRELLNRYDEGKAGSWNRQYVPDAFKSHIDRYERLGTYTAPDDEKLDILIIYLTEASKLERARTALRNFVAHYLKTRGEKESGLVAFVSPTEQTWRFSFVKMEYESTLGESGRVSVSTNLTPARRFSYLVGEGESCHTAQSRFVYLLQETSTNPGLDDIANAFSVETVTKEFFAQYYRLFQSLHKALDKIAASNRAVRDEFRSKGIRTDDFAKKLLGQIVFLYFLQKKGWLGVQRSEEWGSGARDFLRRLAEGKYGRFNNFFDDVLEPLFYETLATDRGAEAWCAHLNTRIPFLNGGLFEPLSDYDWKKTSVVIPNQLFFNTETTTDGDTGTGILDVFDRYNFTVNEAEPLEQEVAIDPEMLGQVFENLIDENLRKGIGAFYTPRKIVHFMCQEALIGYLHDVLSKEVVPVASPELQAGLFLEANPVQGVLAIPVRRDDLAALVHVGDQAVHYEAALKAGTTSYEKIGRRLSKAIEAHARRIDNALRDVAMCDPAIGSGAFPVGMMTEIVRARLALNPYFLDDADRNAYHFKRHAIHNCLYGVDIDRGAVEIAKLRLWLSLVVDEEDVKDIKPLPNLDFKIVSGNSLLGFRFQSQGLTEIERLKERYFDEPDYDRKAKLKEQIDNQIQARLAESESTLGYRVDFDFRLFFSEVFRKKGGFDVVIANPPYGLLNKRQNKHESILVTDNELNYFKTSPEYAPARGGMINVFRLFIVRSLTILRPGGCFAEIFPLAFAGDSSAAGLREHLLTQHQVMRMEAFPERDNERKRVFEAVKMSVCIVILSAHKNLEQPFDLRVHTDRYVDPRNEIVALSRATIETIDDAKYSIPLLRGKELAVLEAVYKRGVRLSSFAHCYTGEVDLTQDKEHLTDDTRSTALLKGAMLDRYLIRDSMSQGEILFLKAKSFLHENRGERTRHHQFPRIVMQGITGVNERIRLKMTVAPKGVFCANSVNYVVLEKPVARLEYLLAILNSSLLNFIFSKTSTNSNVNGYEVDNLPMKLVDGRHAQTLTELSERILALKQKNPAADTKVLERDIDRLVYNLYELTEEDIAIVEGKVVR